MTWCRKRSVPAYGHHSTTGSLRPTVRREPMSKCTSLAMGATRAADVCEKFWKGIGEATCYFVTVCGYGEMLVGN